MISWKRTKNKQPDVPKIWEGKIINYGKPKLGGCFANLELSSGEHIFISIALEDVKIFEMGSSGRGLPKKTIWQSSDLNSVGSFFMSDSGGWLKGLKDGDEQTRMFVAAIFTFRGGNWIAHPPSQHEALLISMIRKILPCSSTKKLKQLLLSIK